MARKRTLIPTYDPKGKFAIDPANTDFDCISEVAEVVASLWTDTQDVDSLRLFFFDSQYEWLKHQPVQYILDQYVEETGLTEEEAGLFLLANSDMDMNR